MHIRRTQVLLSVLLTACGSASTPASSRPIPRVTILVAPPTAELVLPAPTQPPATVLAPPVAEVPATPTVSVATAAPAAPPEPTPTPEPGPAPTLAPAPAPPGGSDILTLHNQVRGERGLAAYANSDLLAQAAQTQADFLASLPAQTLFSIGNGGHTGADGSTYAQRIARTGYSAAATNESWAYQADAAGCFDWWKNDRWHLPAIIDAGLTQLGVGLRAHPAGGMVCVTVYARPA
jgi:uncharacterized protein YkwD